jgi:hypothetical protein
MSAHSAERRLVKSSPELWAEVSDQESLGRRLHAFGEIRITGTDPETTVAWEGDEVSGTVAIASAGWGTKVTLTVEVDDPPAATPDPPAPAPEVIAAPEPEPTVALEPEPARTPEPAAAPEPEPADARPAKPAKQGFFARLFDFGPPIPDPPRQVEASDEPTPEPEPEPTPEPEAAPEAVPEPMPDPIVVPEVEPEVSTEAPEPAPMSAESIVEILSGVLDDLGAAHHRPFSRS